MVRSIFFKITLVLVLMTIFVQPGCKSNEDNDDDTQANSNGGDDDSGVSEDSDSFTGVVKDVVSSNPLPGIEVVPLSNDVDFTEIGDKVTTDSEGRFTFEDLEDELMCVKVIATEGENAIVDTYTCNVPTDEKDFTVSSLPLSIAAGIGEMLYPDGGSDPTLASASGFISYETKNGDMIPVDCATIEVEDETQDPDVFYFEGVMPDVEATQTDSGGRFLVTRLTPGEVTLNAMVDGEKIGSVTIPIQAPADSGATTNSNVTRIVADEIGDPTPDPACAN